MGKLKVGDKVRSLVTQIDVRAGELYEVKTVDDGDVWALDDVGDDFYLTSDEFEILPVAAQTFKVGDRVRTEGWARFYDVVGVEDGHIWVKLYDGSSSKESTEGKTFEFETTPLKIEAGKYYRTRDGRKVGPLMARNNDSYAFAADIAGDIGIRIFQEDGVHGSRWIGNKPNLDLIAEWVDEPVKASAPVAVQQDAPNLTVKLSFDAADVTNAIKSTLLKTNQGYGFEIARHGGYVWVDTGKKAPIVLKATDVQAAA